MLKSFWVPFAELKLKLQGNILGVNLCLKPLEAGHVK